MHGRPFSAGVTLPPLAAVWLAPGSDAGGADRCQTPISVKSKRCRMCANSSTGRQAWWNSGSDVAKSGRTHVPSRLTANGV